MYKGISCEGSHTAVLTDDSLILPKNRSLDCGPSLCVLPPRSHPLLSQNILLFLGGVLLRCVAVQALESFYQVSGVNMILSTLTNAVGNDVTLQIFLPVFVFLAVSSVRTLTSPSSPISLFPRPPALLTLPSIVLYVQSTISSFILLLEEFPGPSFGLRLDCRSFTVS